MSKELLGELKEFKEATIHRLTRMEGKIDSLFAFRWKMAGMMVALLALSQVGLTIVLQK